MGAQHAPLRAVAAAAAGHAQLLFAAHLIAQMAPVQAPVLDHTQRLPPRHRCVRLRRVQIPRLRRRPLLLMLVLQESCCAA